MYNRKEPLKSDYVADELRRRITNREFADGRLPKKIELVSHFGVSQRTVETALKTLAREGLIHGVKGTGTFVNAQAPAEINMTHRLVMVVMPFTNHFFSDLFENLRQKLLSHSLYPVSYLPDDSLLGLSNATNFLSAPIKGVIYHGLSYWRRPFLTHRENIRSVAVDQYEYDAPPTGGAVLSDYETGAYQLARHFLEHGCTRLTLVCPKPAPNFPTSPRFQHYHFSNQMRRGIQKALDEANLGQLVCSQLDFSNPDPDCRRIILENHDGYICTNDFLAYRLQILAPALGRTCPKDFLLSGCYDTPWSTNAPLQITSLGIDIDTMNSLAVNMLEDGSCQQVTIPTIPLWRQSTGDQDTCQRRPDDRL